MESLLVQSLSCAFCLMICVSAWIVGSGFGYSQTCLANVFIVVLFHLLVVVVCSILGFHLKAFLLLLTGLGFELLSGEVEIAEDPLVQAAVRT